ncbi:MAG: type II toxin-antitoxin system YafQ family toxin [Synergistaceae bacterium]|nr:type II toxin-antitoxin system YafQ family toxin [Synergistaceae bacterium]
MAYEVKLSKRYRKDLKRVLAGGADESKLDGVVDILASGEQLPAKYRDHDLKGKWKGCR